MHTPTHPHTHTGKHNKGINFHLFISQFPTRCAWLHKTGCSGTQRADKICSFSTARHKASLLLLPSFWRIGRHACPSEYTLAWLRCCTFLSSITFFTFVTHWWCLTFKLVHFSVTVQTTLSLWGVQHFMVGIRPAGQKMYTSHTHRKCTLHTHTQKKNIFGVFAITALHS